MSITKTFLPLFALVGCSQHGQTPEPFGVPITGGTMLVTKDGRAVVADPDRDRIVTLQVATGAVLSEIELTAGDEPGRLVEDAAGRVHVALRRGGGLVTLDAAGVQTDRRYACGEPRGLAYDAATDSIHVACTGGELVTLAAAGGAASRVVHLDRDLRDVIVSGSQLVVTRFRTAEILTLDASGAIVSRAVPPTVVRFEGGFGGLPDAAAGDGTVNAAASTAWRTIALPDGRIVMSHQRKVKNMLDSQQPGGYGGDCGGGPIEDAVTIMTPGIAAPHAVGQIGRAALPVDIAVSPSGDTIALVSAGNGGVTVVPVSALGNPDESRCDPQPQPCGDDGGPPPRPPTPPTMGSGGAPDTRGGMPAMGGCCKDDDHDGRCDDDGEGDDGEARLGAPTSVAFTPTGEVVIFYPEAPALVVRDAAGITSRRIALPGHAANDAGRNVFHHQTRIGIACASCHPEGRDDGLVWNFAQSGLRRTQSLAGHILERAPYHWTGDMSSLPVLMDNVFAVRMAGGQLSQREKSALGPWLNRIPVPTPAAVDTAAAARGQAIFESAEVACVGCHNGSLLTNNALANVGTGGNFKVPSLLGVGSRPPYMHDGCAQTLMDRFVTCNTALHGNTAGLSAEQLSDLVAYLNSL